MMRKRTKFLVTLTHYSILTIVTIAVTFLTIVTIAVTFLLIMGMFELLNFFSNQSKHSISTCERRGI
jgi:hypothetical protein